MTDDLASLESSYHEKLTEYVFLLELLQESWLVRGRQIAVMRPDVDNAGYDLALECEGVIRHIQLKSSRWDAKTSRQGVNAKLGDLPGGCVIWLFHKNAGGRVKLGYQFFGGDPGERPELGDKVDKHTKANAQGVKTPRTNRRVLNKGQFEPVDDVGKLIDKLFPKSQPPG